MAKWFVIIEVDPAAEDAEEVDVERLSQLGDFLDDVEGSPMGGGRRYGAVLSVDDESPPGAFIQGFTRFSEARAKAGLPDWPVARAEVLTGLETARRVHADKVDLAGPDDVAHLLETEVGSAAPSVMGVREAIETIGVSRQRFSKLIDRPDFPEPIAVLAATPVWRRSAIEAYARGRNTHPGRPPVDTWERVENVLPAR